jgi:hypothetical protein
MQSFRNKGICLLFFTYESVARFMKKKYLAVDAIVLKIDRCVEDV